jgi:hypothetical protein
MITLMNSATKDQVKEVAKWIRRADKLCAKYQSSLMTKASDRIAALDCVLSYAEPCRAAAYPVAWGVDTGRASTEFVAALVALSPVKFAQIACDIATQSLCVRDAWDAWKTAVAA